jgi:hypothetical protein
LGTGGLGTVDEEPGAKGDAVVAGTGLRTGRDGAFRGLLKQRRQGGRVDAVVCHGFIRRCGSCHGGNSSGVRDLVTGAHVDADSVLPGIHAGLSMGWNHVGDGVLRGHDGHGRQDQAQG